MRTVLTLLGLLALSSCAVAPTMAEADAYSCYGSSRYEEMAHGTPCPNLVKWDEGYLRSHYDCAWLNRMRRRYTDDQLEALAKKWHLPDWLIQAAKECPREADKH